MADYIYAGDGRARAFRLGDNLFAMDGTPLGRVWAERVYTFAGSYVGALSNNMVVDRPNASRRKLPSVPVPDRAAGRGDGDRRHPIAAPYPECFDLLLPDAPGSRLLAEHEAPAEA